MATPLRVFLAELEGSIQVFDPLMKRITAKAGDQIAAEAKRNAPKRTGALRTSIKSQGVKKGVGSISVQVTAGGPSQPHDVDYATYVEEGTSRMAPQPFMRPAVDKVLPDWEKEMAEVVQLLAAGRPARAKGSIRR